LISLNFYLLIFSGTNKVKWEETSIMYTFPAKFRENSKRFFNLLLLISFLYLNVNWYQSQSQSTTYLDSLQSILEQQTLDNDRIQLLELLSQGYIQIDPSKSLAFADQLLNISSKKDIVSGIIKANSLKSQAYRSMYSLDTALLFCDIAIHLADSLNDLNSLADLYSKKGHILFLSTGPKAGITHYISSYGLFDELSDSIGMSNSLNGIGAMYMRLSKYDSAIYYFMELVSISEKMEFEESLGKGYLNLGISYLEIQDFDNALTYFNKSIPLNDKNQRQDFVSMAYNGLGNISRFKGHMKDALTYYNNALNILEKLNDKKNEANILNNIGNVYEEEGEYNQALYFYREAKSRFEIVSDWDGFTSSYINIGLINARNKNYDQALKIYDSCLITARKFGSLYRIQEAYHAIYKTYQLKKDYKKAFENLESYNIFKDSIFIIEKMELIADLQLKYEKEKDQATILSLENENLEKDLDLRRKTNQRNVYLFTGSGTIAILFFFFIFHRQKTRKDKIIADQKIKQLEEEKKLLAAKFLVEGQEEERKRIAQELHDGLGVLLSTTKMQFTTIKDKSPENKPIIEKATKLLEQATGDVRKISHNMMPGLLTRFGFYEAAEDLFDKVNETERLNAELKIVGDTKRLPENTEIMLYRIIQEMVNNTIKHAEASNILLDLNIQPELLNIRYSDDGKGFDVEEKIESKSIGLQSIQSRVNFLNGKTEIKSEPTKGVNYIIQIPV